MATYEVYEISGVIEMVQHSYGGSGSTSMDDDGPSGSGPMGIWGVVEG